GDHFEDPAQRVAVRPRRPDQLDRALGEILVARADHRLLDRRPPRVLEGVAIDAQLLGTARLGGPDAADVAADLDLERLQEQLGQRAGGHPRGRFAGAGALEYV